MSCDHDSTRLGEMLMGAKPCGGPMRTRFRQISFFGFGVRVGSVSQFPVSRLHDHWNGSTRCFRHQLGTAILETPEEPLLMVRNGMCRAILFSKS